MEAIIELISNLGFPIACVVYLFYTNAKQRELHSEENKSFVDAIQNNTLVIQKLTDKLDAIEDKIREG